MANGTWKIARGKGAAAVDRGGCRPRRNPRAAGPGAVHLVRPGAQLFFRRNLAGSPVGACSGRCRGALDGSIDSIFSVYQENLRLKEENARLRQWQNAAFVLEQRIKRYQLLLNAVPDPSLTVLTAHVIGRANHPFVDTMILDAGRIRGSSPARRSSIPGASSDGSISSVRAPPG